jgi:hypothetical protein
MTTEKHKSQRSETALVGECRIAFPFHHEKRTKSAGGRALDKPRHDAVVLVPKLHPEATQCGNYATLAGLCMQAATKAWGQWPQGGKWPIQDGDIPHQPKPKPGVTPLTPEQIAQKNAWRKGYWVIEVSTNLDPGPRVCLLQNGVAQEIPAKVVAGQSLYKSGDYGYVSLNAYTFHNETFGVNFGYEGVLYTRPGEAIGSSGPRSAQQMFGSVAGMVAPAASPAAPAAGAPPAPPMPAAPAAQGYVQPGPAAAAPVAPVAQPAPAMPAPPVAPTAAPAMPAPPAPPQMPGAPGVLPAFPQPAAQ